MGLFLRRFSNGRSESQKRFFSRGFHGDLYLIGLASHLLDRCDVFIETGTNVGSTLAFVGERYPELPCRSCEPDAKACETARATTCKMPNISVANTGAIAFLAEIIESGDFDAQIPVFWLDAHGCGFRWPLQDEVRLITNHWQQAWILIDDFLVPEMPCFGYDEYDGQICSFDYVKDHLSPDHAYQLVYPTYADKTSEHHPLRGWGLIAYGDTALDFPEEIASRIRVEPYSVASRDENGASKNK